MKYCLLSALLFLVFFILPPTSYALTTGVQIPSDQTLERLIPSSYKYQAVKYQYSLNSDQPIEQWVKNAKQNGYQVLVSVAKNFGRKIPTLQTAKVTEFSSQWCPYENELESRNEFKGYDEFGQPIYEPRREDFPTGNGYLEFMHQMEDVGNKLKKYGVDGIEIWNEPNLVDEWTNQGLGAVDPRNYAIFLECGVKGLRHSGYSGKIISAALAPLAPYKNGDDLLYFNEFVNAGGLTGPKYTGKYSIDAIGWHSNVVKDIPPEDPNPEGFQRVKFALNKGKSVWITEFGWARDLAHIDRSRQSSYIVSAFSLAPKLGNIEGMFVWNYGFTKDGGDPSFAQWDIEPSDSSSNECVPGSGLSGGKDTDFVTTDAFLKHEELTKRREKALLDENLTQSLENNVANNTEVRIAVNQGFFDQATSAIHNLLCGLIGRYCLPHFAVVPDGSSSNQDPTGKNTFIFQQRAQLLNKSMVPEDVKLIPEQSDCNIQSLSESAGNGIRGDEKLDSLSSNLGSTTGNFAADLPLQQIADVKEQVDQQAKTNNNISIGSRIFAQDKRAPDACVKLQLEAQGYFDEAVASSFGCPRQ